MLNSIKPKPPAEVNPHCQYNSKVPCLKSSCQTCQVNIDHALKIQSGMENYWSRWNSGDINPAEGR